MYEARSVLLAFVVKPARSSLA